MGGRRKSAADLLSILTLFIKFYIFSLNPGVKLK